ncbi:MAG: TIM44-like domain-containing protein, partial [Solirubrobacterales bacterium]|nr:TIM44-like domain-containing protein [Solirubrobacterales bacterium]
MKQNMVNRIRSWRLARVDRALVAVGGALFLSCVTAGSALAAAGGGSAGFGGGGGGFGGGGGGFGGGFGGSGGGGCDGSNCSGGIAGALLGGLILAVIVGLFLIWLAHRLASVERRLVRAERRRRAGHREHRVEAAAAEAAEEDPAFAAEAVHADAAKLFLAIQKAWSDDDRSRLRDLVGPELWVEWQRRLSNFHAKGWRNVVQPRGAPSVQYVGLHRVGNDRDDRVVVRIEATLHDYVRTRTGRRVTHTGSSSEVSRLCEYWTLAKQPNRKRKSDPAWIVVSIEQEREGGHELREKIVATPWMDDAAMRDQALVEQATADAVPEGTNIAELADLDLDGDVRAQANDLSVADGRFAPDVLEVAARRAVAAWAHGIDGDRHPLESLADQSVVQELLHPGDRTGKTRLVVRGPQVKEIRITALDANADPPAMSLEVHLQGKRYIEDRDTTKIVSGSQSRD